MTGPNYVLRLTADDAALLAEVLAPEVKRGTMHCGCLTPRARSLADMRRRLLEKLARP